VLVARRTVAPDRRSGLRRSSIFSDVGQSLARQRIGDARRACPARRRRRPTCSVPVEEVSAYAAKVAARAAAPCASCATCDLKASAEQIDRLGLTGADRPRGDAARFTRLAARCLSACF
jgi:hypothetical protein